MQPDPDTVKRLRQHSVFAELTEDEIASILGTGSLRRVPDGEAILSEGADPDSACLLLGGRGRVVTTGRRGVHELAVLETGSLVGEVGLLGGLPRNATVQAIGDVEAFTIERAGFEKLLDELQPAACKLLRSLSAALARRQQEMNDRIVQLMERAADPEATQPIQISDLRDQLFDAAGHTS